MKKCGESVSGDPLTIKLLLSTGHTRPRGLTLNDMEI
jgi:hypothetical protein